MALDILQTLVRAYGVVSNSKSGENPTIQSRPLSQILVVNAFPAAVKCTLRSDDNAVTQVSVSQCGNFRIFLSIRFYVKSIFEILEFLNLQFLQF